MKWTREVPTVEGYYWIKAWSGLQIWLAEFNDDGDLYWDDLDDPPPLVSEYEDCDRPPGYELHYAGPIPKPIE